MTTLKRITAVGLVILGMAVSATRGECVTGWKRGYGIPDVDGDIYAMVAWDDGTGSALYVAGSFRVAGNAFANNIARWNGYSFSPLGSGTSGPVYCLSTYDGQLIAGGTFATAGGTSVNNVARWNGSSWSGLDSGTQGPVRAITVYNGNLIAGGSFESAGALGINCVASWNGTAWSSLGTCTGEDGPSVDAFTTFDGELIAGGCFSSIGGIGANSIAKWNGASWSPLGEGITGGGHHVYALDVFHSSLIVGGSFATAGNTPASNIAAWSDDAWSACGSGTNGTVRTLVRHPYDGVYYESIVVGGDFTQAGGVSTIGLAAWQGASYWSSFYYWHGTGRVNALAVCGDDLYAAQAATDMKHLVLCRPQWGGWFPTGGMNGRVEAMTTWNGSLVRAGQFTPFSDPPVRYIDGLDMTTWIDGVPPDAAPFKLAVYNSELIVGGQFTNPLGVTVKNIARWNGSRWAALGSGVDGAVTAMTVFGNNLYVASTATDNAGVTTGRLASWNGSSWSTVASGPDLYIGDLIVYSSTPLTKRLIVAGNFGAIGGVTANNVAQWTGSTWQPLGNGIGSPADACLRALAVYNGNLIAAGTFATAGGSPGNNVACWNRTTWSSLGAGVNSTAWALTVYNGHLVAGGDFTSANGRSVNHLATWDGIKWQPLGEGVDGRVYCLALYDNDLNVGGDFLIANGSVSAYYARWGPLVPDVVSVRHDTFTCGVPVYLGVTANYASTYQWRRGTTILQDIGQFSGTQTPTLTIDPVSSADAGYDYNCVLTNECGSVTTGNFWFSLYPPKIGDFNGDCFANDADVGMFMACLTGPGRAIPAECNAEDLDHDTDVDQSDFGLLQRCFTEADGAYPVECK